MKRSDRNPNRKDEGACSVCKRKENDVLSDYFEVFDFQSGLFDLRASAPYGPRDCAHRAP